MKPKLIAIILAGLMSLSSWAVARAHLPSALAASRTLAQLSAASSPYDDNFNSPKLSRKWSWIRESPGNWSLMAHPGYLRILVEGKDLQQGDDTAPLLLQHAPMGNFEISTYVRMAPTQQFQQGCLIMYDDDNNYVRLTYVYAYARPTFEFAEMSPDTGFQEQLVPVSSATPAPGYFLQIDKRGSTYKGYSSKDGLHWSLIGTITFLTLRPAHIGLSAFSYYDLIPHIPADFAFFQERHLSSGITGPLPARKE